MINPRDIPIETVRVATEANAIATQNQTELRSLVDAQRRKISDAKFLFETVYATPSTEWFKLREKWMEEPLGWKEQLDRESIDLTTQLHTLQEQNKSLTKGLEEAVKALEYCGCHEHSESPCDESGSHYSGLCEFCKQVDHALATAQPLLKPLISDKEVSRDA